MRPPCESIKSKKPLRTYLSGKYCRACVLRENQRCREAEGEDKVKVLATKTSTGRNVATLRRLCAQLPAPSQHSHSLGPPNGARDGAGTEPPLVEDSTCSRHQTDYERVATGTQQGMTLRAISHIQSRSTPRARANRESSNPLSSLSLSRHAVKHAAERLCVVQQNDLESRDTHPVPPPPITAEAEAAELAQESGSL